MFTWNHRVIRHGDCFAIHEVSYNAKGKITGWTTPPIVVGATIDELDAALHRMLRALETTVIVAATQEFSP